MNSNSDAAERLQPDQRPLTEMQSQRLAGLTGLEARDLAGLNVVEIREKFRWVIDPELLFFRRVCGRVVKTDPATGVEYPVPFATVHVEDTDCNLLGYFPPAWPWGWFFPLFCHREEIATTTTDACGRFCVYIPRWEIDWILYFRRLRVCFPTIFVRPTIKDILDDLMPELDIVRPPRPGPDPSPFLLKEGGLTLLRAEQLLGRGMVDKLATFEAGAMLGASTSVLEQTLTETAFDGRLAPPVSDLLRQLGRAQRQDAQGEMDEIAGEIGIEREALKGFNLDRYIGPFRSCFDFLIPQWMPIFDVPDVTFRVTQDVDSDGDEEVIYSDGYFDVRWNSGPIPDVKLTAGPSAIASLTCDTPDVLCEDTPGILFAGLMPVENPPAPADPYHDAGTGYARRPNRPHPSGDLSDPLPNPLAETPYSGTLQLYGCHQIEGASFYRLRYAFNGDAPAPFTGLSWPMHRLVGGVLNTIWTGADTEGWYPILPEAENWFPEHLLLNWPTTSFPDGTYVVDLQLGDAGKNLVDTSAAIAFRVDNSSPFGKFTELRWREAGGAWSPPLNLICPTIVRPYDGGDPANLEFMVSYLTSAQHLRSVIVSAGGCGGGTPTLVSAPSTAQHWHTDPTDNAFANTATFALSGSSPQGAYSFNMVVASRAFNPAGGDGGFEADWNYDPVRIWIHRALPVAVVNA